MTAGERPGTLDAADPWPAQDASWPFIAPAPACTDPASLALALLILGFLAAAGVVLWQAHAAARRGELVVLNLRGSL